MQEEGGKRDYEEFSWDQKYNGEGPGPWPRVNSGTQFSHISGTSSRFTRRYGGDPNTTLCLFHRKGSPYKKQGCPYQHPQGQDSYLRSGPQNGWFPKANDLRGVIGSKQYVSNLKTDNQKMKKELTYLRIENARLQKEKRNLVKELECMTKERYHFEEIYNLRNQLMDNSYESLKRYKSDIDTRRK